MTLDPAIVESVIATVVIALIALLVTLFLSGVSLRWLGLLVGGVLAAFPVIWTNVLRDYQRERLTAFLDPTADPLGIGYQTQQVRDIAATRDGRWFTVRIMPYRTLDDRIDGVVITFTDISVATAGKPGPGRTFRELGRQGFAEVPVARGVTAVQYRGLPRTCEGCHSDFHQGAFKAQLFGNGRFHSHSFVDLSRFQKSCRDGLRLG